MRISWNVAAAAAFAAVVFGIGAVAAWKLLPPKSIYAVNWQFVPKEHETRQVEYRTRGAREPVRVEVERPGRDVVRTVTREVPVTVTREHLVEVFPQVLTLEFDPAVRVRFGDEVVTAQLAGDPRVSVVLVSRPGEPPAYAPVRLPDVDAPLTVRSVVTDTKIVVRERKAVDVRVYLGTALRVASGAGFGGMYAGAEVERRFGTIGPLERFCRARGDYFIGSRAVEARVECGLRW